MKSKTSSIYEMLFTGLEEELDRDKYNESMEAVGRTAFRKIISDSKEGKIQWKRDLSGKVYARTQAVVRNYKGENVSVPVVFFSVHCPDTAWADRYLKIGDRDDGPSDSGAEVRNFAMDFFRLPGN